MLLFGTILLLNLTDLPPYTVIWYIRLFVTVEMSNFKLDQHVNEMMITAGKNFRIFHGQVFL